MSMGVLGVAIVDGELRPVPKHALNLRELFHALGSQQLVTQLRKIGVLVPVEEETKVQLFDAGHVAEVWARYVRGEYKQLLAELRRG